LTQTRQGFALVLTDWSRGARQLGQSFIQTIAAARDFLVAKLLEL
jgi:hypothetical protein